MNHRKRVPTAFAIPVLFGSLLLTVFLVRPIQEPQVEAVGPVRVEDESEVVRFNQIEGEIDSQPNPISNAKETGTSPDSPHADVPLAPLDRFDLWLGEFQQDPTNPELLTLGIHFAQERRPLMSRLIEDDPEEALRRAVPTAPFRGAPGGDHQTY